jgi:hypothetical protein
MVLTRRTSHSEALHLLQASHANAAAATRYDAAPPGRPEGTTSKAGLLVETAISSGIARWETSAQISGEREMDELYWLHEGNKAGPLLSLG